MGSVELRILEARGETTLIGFDNPSWITLGGPH